MEHSEIINGQGSIQSVLKRIGVNGSNVFCCGTDPLLQSGIIVSQGKIVSSKILDIRIKSSNLLAIHDHVNKIEVTFVNADSKLISTMSFNILNDNTLHEIVDIAKHYDELNNTVDNHDKEISCLSTKLSNINTFINSNETNIESIPELKYKINALENKIEALEKIIIKHINT